MTADMIETEIGIEIGWTMVTIAVGAHEHGVGAEVQSENAIIGFGSESRWIGTENGIGSVIIVISIADEISTFQWFRLFNGMAGKGLLVMYFAWRSGVSGRTGHARYRRI